MANSPLQHAQPAWALKITRTVAGSPPVVTDFLAASSDLTEPADVTALSAVYTKRITNAQQIRVIDQLGDWSGGIISPSTATITLDNHDGYYSTSAEWRGCAAILYHYERSEGVVRTALDGIVTEFDCVLGRFTVTIATHDPSIWSTLIPRAVVNPTEFPSAQDMGAPIPVVFGSAFLSPPCCGVDIEDPADGVGGYDFLVGVQEYESGSSTDLQVEALYYDQDPASAGAELANGWMNCPGAITYDSPSTFTAAGGDHSQWYNAATVTVDGRTYYTGPAFRTVTIESGYEGQWQYGWIGGYVAGTGVVTVGGVAIDATTETGGFISAVNMAPTAAGSGYAVGDVLTIVSLGASYGQVVVAAVNGSGGVTRITLKHPGLGYLVASGLATTGGAGTSCTVEVTELVGPQIAADYFAENARYVTDGQELLSCRVLQDKMPAGVVVRAKSRMQNPALVIKEILVNTTWGLGQTIDTTSFTDAAADYVTAGLGTAINACLGGDRQQRQAGQVMRELLALYGGRLTKTSAGWALTVDSAPAAAAVTFGVDDGTFNNVKRVETNAKRSLSDAIRTLTLRFGPTGRIKSSADYGSAYLPGNYSFAIVANCLSVGSDQTIISPWLRYSAHAQRVLAYASKAIKYGDQQPVIVVGQEARVVAIGDLVTYLNVTDGLNASFRVWRIERRLADIRLSLASYNAAQFTYDAADTTVANDVLDLDESRGASGHGGNLILNSDFSAGVRSATKAANMVPGWEMMSPSMFNSLVVTEDSATIGGHYLTVPVTTASAGSPAQLSTTKLNSSDPLVMGIIPDTLYLASVYCDRATSWRLTGVFFPGSVSSQTGMLSDPTDTNGKGWLRYYTKIRVPADATLTYAALLVEFTATGTFKFDAFQFEEAGSQARPTDWKRNTKWGVDPALLQPGTLTIRLDGESQHGTTLGHSTATVATVAGTQAVFTGLIPAGVVVQGVTTRQIAITGPTEITGIGPAGGDPGAWGPKEGSTIPISNGYQTSGTDFNVVGVSGFNTATDVVVTFDAETTGGQLTATVHWMRFDPPTG